MTVRMSIMPDVDTKPTIDIRLSSITFARGGVSNDMESCNGNGDDSKVSSTDVESSASHGEEKKATLMIPDERV